MPNTIQSLSINSNKSYFLNSPNSSANLPAKNPESKKNDYHNSKTILASLSALAVIGASVWGIKHSSKPKPNQIKKNETDVLEAVDVVKDKINKLKKLIFEDYISKKTKIIDQMNKFDEFEYKVPFNTGKDLQDKISVFEKEYVEMSANSYEVISKNKKIIRNKLAALMPDSDWQELKKLRKHFIKTMRTDKDVEQRKIAGEKLILVNDLLINKVYPETIDKYNLYGITNQQAFEIVKKDFKTYDDFTEYYDSIKNMDIPFNFEELDKRFSHNGTLSLKDIFPEEITAIESSTELLDETTKKLTATKILYNKYQSKIKQLAQEYRETDGVKELKELLDDLKALKNSLKNAS